MRCMAQLRTHARALVSSGLAVIALGCGDEAQRQGELMLSVTTDMAVPIDMDRVVWSVTLNGESAPYATRTVEVASGTDFPLTLAVEAGPHTRAPVTIRVEGRKGSEPSLLRASREATLTVPNDRVAELELPLSWLCSEPNLPEGCSEGTTCQAGHCVNAAVSTASLPEFQPVAARDCYDVSACLSSARLGPAGPVTLASGRQVACGISGTTWLGTDANVNVAVEVKNDAIGNYGFCGPFGRCFIPLHRDSEPEGWRVLDNGPVPAIELPSIVCEKSGTSITRIAVMRTSPSCPADRGDRALCSPALTAGCLPAAVCPPTSPEGAWAGYACTDASPFDDQPDLIECWAPPVDTSVIATTNDGRWCCLKGQEPANDPLLIDDMTAGPQIKLHAPPGEVAGFWFADTPDGSGQLEPAPEPSLYSYRQFDEPVTPANGPTLHAAACLRSDGFRGWLAMEGFVFRVKPGAYELDTIDVSDYEGISFWAWAAEPFPDAPLSVKVNFVNTQTSTEPGSECITPEDGVSRCEDFYERVSLTSEWKQYFVRWADIHQSRDDDWGQFYFDAFAPEVYATTFTVAGAGPDVVSQPFDFCVADIRFLKKTEPSR